MLLDPVSRSSRWRTDYSAPKNWDDNQVNCGGFDKQHGENNGKCGICGDNYADVRPRANELGGVFGQGTIVQTYSPNSIINVTVRITASHYGCFEFDICSVDQIKESGGTMEEDECFENLVKTVDDEEFCLKSEKPIDYVITLKLPEDFTCKHCVLRWTYNTANNWGWCDDGKGRLGCGPQETFRNCADVAIV